MVPAHWTEEIAGRVVQLRDKWNPGVRIIGNGDVLTIEDGKAKAEEFGFDGIMIGRGTYGKPWLFSGTQPDLETRIKIMIEHTQLYETLVGIHGKPSAYMKKNFKGLLPN